MKELIMCSLAKLKDGPVNFKRISMTEDYTPEERQAISEKRTNVVYSGKASQPILSTNELCKNKDSDNNLIVTSSSTSSSINTDMLYIWFTNADTLTLAKIQELEN